VQLYHMCKPGHIFSELAGDIITFCLVVKQVICNAFGSRERNGKKKVSNARFNLTLLAAGVLAPFYSIQSKTLQTTMTRFSLPRLLYYHHYTASHSSSFSLLSSTPHLRHFSAACTNYSNEQQLRNIWISGLVDPAKAPLSERYMLHTGQIEKMEEARNKIQRRDARLWWDIHDEQCLNFSYHRSSTRKSSYPTQMSLSSTGNTIRFQFSLSTTQFIFISYYDVAEFGKGAIVLRYAV